MNTRARLFNMVSGDKPMCAYCGFDDERALEIDHVKDNGAYYRKKFGGSDKEWSWRVAHEKIDDLQLLCCNCNRIKVRRLFQANKTNTLMEYEEA